MTASRWLRSRNAAKLRAANEAAEEPPPAAPPPSGPPPPPPPAVAWLEAQEILLGAALEAVNGGILTDGYVIGAKAAQAVIEGIDVDWATWVPGDEDAAAKVLGQLGDGSGLERLLQESPVPLFGIADDRMARFARILADAAARGQSVDELAKRLLEFRDDPVWARMTAHTELARAISVATIDQYAEHDIYRHEWLVAGLDPLDRVRVCKLCAANGAEGPISVGAEFPSGAAYPPQHPRCRCALMPVIDIPEESCPAWLEDLAEMVLPVPDGLDEAKTGGQRLKAYWISGEGAAKWSTWRQLYKHIKKHLPADYAKRVTSQWYHDRYGRWPGAKRHDRSD